MCDLLIEGGVFYSHDKRPDYDYFIPFSYQCRYQGEVVANKIVYCKNANDFIKLIRHWNNKDGKWLFTLS